MSSQDPLNHNGSSSSSSAELDNTQPSFAALQQAFKDALCDPVSLEDFEAACVGPDGWTYNQETINNLLVTQVQPSTTPKMGKVISSPMTRVEYSVSAWQNACATPNFALKGALGYIQLLEKQVAEMRAENDRLRTMEERGVPSLSQTVSPSSSLHRVSCLQADMSKLQVAAADEENIFEKKKTCLSREQQKLQDELVRACYERDLSAVKTLIEQRGAYADKPDSTGAQPMAAAIYSLSLPVLQYLDECLNHPNPKSYRHLVITLGNSFLLPSTGIRTLKDLITLENSSRYASFLFSASWLSIQATAAVPGALFLYPEASGWGRNWAIGSIDILSQEFKFDRLARDLEQDITPGSAGYTQKIIIQLMKQEMLVYLTTKGVELKNGRIIERGENAEAEVPLQSSSSIPHPSFFNQPPIVNHVGKPEPQLYSSMKP